MAAPRPLTRPFIGWAGGSNPAEIDLPAQIERLRSAGIQRVESFAWRDLDDPEAGGSELHADEILGRWAEHGMAIEHRTSTIDVPREFDRRGYRVTQRGGRYDVFARVASAQLARRLRGRQRLDTATIEIWNGVPWMSPWWRPQRSVVWMHHVHREMWRDALPEPLATLGRFGETRLAPLAYRRAAFCTLSESSADEIVGIGVPAQHIVVIPPGVGESYDPDPARRSEHPSVVIVGRLAPVKRHRTAFEELAATRRVHPTLTVDVIGDGPERPGLQRWIDERDAASWIHLRGRVDDAELRTAYQSAWLVVSASHAEGWGMSLTEAGACGTAAVATDIAGHRGAVVDGETGVLVGDDRALGTAVADLLADDDRRGRYAHAARRHAEGLSWTAVAARHAARLADVCETSARPPSP